MSTNVGCEASLALDATAMFVGAAEGDLGIGCGFSRSPHEPSPHMDRATSRRLEDSAWRYRMLGTSGPYRLFETIKFLTHPVSARDFRRPFWIVVGGSGECRALQARARHPGHLRQNASATQPRM